MPAEEARRAPDAPRASEDRLLAQHWLIVAAHPDDDVLGAGGTLREVTNVDVVYVTDGAPADGEDATALGFATRAAYVAARRLEAQQALQLARAGGSAAGVHELGLVDKDAMDGLVAGTQALLARLRALKPTVLLAHPYEGGHPDHDAAAFMAQAAWVLSAADGSARAARWEFASYHADPETGSLRFGAFLPANDAAYAAPGDELVRALDDDALARKTRAVTAHRTQTRVIGGFPLAAERFRPAPLYDFTRAPHPGRLLYEGFAWPGRDGARFRARAGAALQALGVDPARAC